MAVTLSTSFVLSIATLILGAVVMLQWTDWRALAGRTLSSSERQEKLFADARRAVQRSEDSRNPQRWARAQIALGRMLTEHGAGAKDRVSVEAGIVAYRDALSVLSPDQDWISHRPRGKILGVPCLFTPRGLRTNRWAEAQHGLGFSLGNLGALTDRLELFDEANDAYRAAQTVFRREHDPGNWANTQNALAITYRFLAENGRPGAGDEAVALYQDLLDEESKGSASPAANGTLFTYASALMAKSELGDGRASLDKAVGIFRQIADQTDSDQSPDLFALTRRCLGDALRRLGQQTDDADALEEAFSIHRAELEIEEATASPIQRAGVTDEIGAALRELGRMRADPALLREAATCFRDALEVLRPDEQRLNWAEVQDNLASTLTLLYRLEGEEDLPGEAETAIRKALEIRTQDRFPLLWAISTDTFGTVLHARAVSEDRQDLAAAALATHRAALEIFESLDARYRLRVARMHLDDAEAAVTAFVKGNNS